MATKQYKITYVSSYGVSYDMVWCDTEYEAVMIARDRYGSSVLSIRAMS
jgi:hypothetical protein